MKKLLTLIAAATLLTACGEKSTRPLQLNPRAEFTIMSPTGAPSLAFYNCVRYNRFETNADPSTGILPLMIAGQKDVVVLPTNAGMQAILKRGAQYKIAATVSFGNFYLVSMGNDANNEIGADDNIVLFQKDNVPDKIFHYIYGNDLDAGIHYLPAVSDAASAAIGGSYVDAESGERLVPNYVLLAQPVLTNVLAKNTSVSVYANIQEKYKEKSNNLPLFQASIFVKNDLDKKKVDRFLFSIKEDVINAIDDPDKITNALEGMENANQVFGVAPSLAVTVTKNNNGMGLGFEYAKDNKEAIANFLKLFNIEGYSEEVYYQ